MKNALRRLLFSRVYSIGILTGSSPLVLAPAPNAGNPVLTSSSVTDVHALFVADPFMLNVDRTWYMFFEVMSWRNGSKRGEIGLATSCDGVRWTYREIVLAEPFHLSFPYVFASGSDFYMVPETCAAGAVRLYRADPFPKRWVFVSNLLVGPVHVDNCVFEWEGRWWLLTETDPRLKGTLRLFYSMDVTGPWREHPKSPVVSANPSDARPAGRVLSLQDRLLRFAQDCSAEYGQGVHAFEITVLTTTRYEEREVRGNPVLAGSGHGWNHSGMHHVDAHRLDNGHWIACVDGWSQHLRRPRDVVGWAAGQWSRPISPTQPDAAARHLIGP